jgi:hypothetical protein
MKEPNAAPRSVSLDPETGRALVELASVRSIVADRPISLAAMVRELVAEASVHESGVGAGVHPPGLPPRLGRAENNPEPRAQASASTQR